MAKSNRKTRKQQHQQQHQDNDVIQLNSNQRRMRHVTLNPRNHRQEDYIQLLDNSEKHIIFAIGPAGTGKTLLGVLASIRALQEGTIDKIVVTRPAISVDEQHGFLPGTLEEKMAPWTRPIFDIFQEYFNKKQIDNMLEDGMIEIAPLAYMRGRTFKNAFIVADEMQNATISQMKMLLTRIGDGSRIAVTGDLAQHDRGYEENGLKDFLIKLSRSKSKMIGMVEFQRQDVERHVAVAEILKIYGDED